MFVRLQKLDWLVENNKVSYFTKELLLNVDNIISISDSTSTVRDLENSQGLSEQSWSTVELSNGVNMIVLGNPGQIIKLTRKNNKKDLLHG